MRIQVLIIYTLKCLRISSAQTSLLGNRNRRRPRTRESLNGQDLVIEIAIAEPVLGPDLEVVGSSNRTRGALALTNRPILCEGAGSSDGWLVGSCVGADGVGTAVRLNSPELRCLGARVIGAIRLDDVVLGLGRVDPAVDG